MYQELSPALLAVTLEVGVSALSFLEQGADKPPADRSVDCIESLHHLLKLMESFRGWLENNQCGRMFDKEFGLD